MRDLTQRVLELAPPWGLFDETVVANLFPDHTKGARIALVHRAVSAGKALRLKPGLYCLAEPYQKARPHPFVVATVLHAPSHISLEAALWHHGMIPETAREISSVTLARSRRYDTPLGSFSFHRVPSTSPRAGVEAVEIEPRGWAFVADPLRAIADLVYLRRDVTWRAQGVGFLTDSLRIELEDLEAMSFRHFEEMRDGIRSRRVRAFLDGLREVLHR